MRRVNTAFLRPGMVVARSIYSSRGQVLLRESTILTERYIERLKTLGIPCIYIRESQLSLPVMIDVISDATRVDAMVKVRELLESASSSGLAIRPDDSLQSVKDMVDELLHNRHTVVNLTDIRLDDDYLFAHSVNTCVMALLAGISLGYSKERLHELGLGALFHDAGKMLLPKTILDKPGPLSDREFAIVKHHPEHGYKLLKNMPSAREIAYKHHERYDGSGYPRGISGKACDELSQITAMADVFDALTSSRQYRLGYPHREAYEFLAANCNRHFELHLVEAFLKNVAAYPCGEVVELNDQSIAIVLETQHGYPLQPRVRLLRGHVEVNLSQADLHIVRVLPGYEAQALLQDHKA